MNGDLEEYCKNCKTCSKFQNNQCKNPLLVHDVPKLPWSEVGSDVFEYRQKYYLVLVDNLSNFIEVRQIRDLTSDEIILNMKSIFSVHGIPIKLYTDGARYYTSMAFKEFSKTWNIQHIVSSPYMPQSNGQAESAVKIVKNIFKKCDDSGQGSILALLHIQKHKQR